MEVGGTLQIHLLCFFPMVDQIPTINERGCGLPLPFSQRPVSVLSMAFHWLRFYFFLSLGIQIKPPHGTKASTITEKHFVKKKKKKKAILPEKNTQLLTYSWCFNRVFFFLLLICLSGCFTWFDYVFLHVLHVPVITMKMKETFACVLSSHRCLYDHLSKTSLLRSSGYFQSLPHICSFCYVRLQSEFFISMKKTKMEKKTQ